MDAFLKGLRERAEALAQAIDSLSEREENTLEGDLAVALALTALEDAGKLFKETVKTRLREDAKAKQPDAVLGGGRVGYSIPAGKATVDFVRPSYRLKKGADITALQKALGEDFGRVFCQKVTWQVLPEGLQEILQHPRKGEVFEAISSSSTPRVGFRSKK
jgi:methyl coenzyme M reductase subunit C-like uncharacterized protein (methanogenesis marker protein 7)